MEPITTSNTCRVGQYPTDPSQRCREHHFLAVPYTLAQSQQTVAFWTQYSDSMSQLLRNGYRAKKRPSGHSISTKFSNDNGAAIPPNLIAAAKHRKQLSIPSIL